jgi:predicted amino acid racemase
LYPLLEINLSIVEQNTRAVASLCRKNGIEVAAVTKAFGGNPQIAQAYLDAGLKTVGDSRLDNLERLKGLPCEKWLIRSPSPREAERAVELCDASLNTEWETIQALEKAAKAAGRRHKVILMLDLGDLREGYLSKEDLLRDAERARRSPYLSFYGIGANLACLNYVLPDEEKLALLSETARESGAEVVSCGNSASIDLMARGGVPKGMGLRLGESLLFGRERANYQRIEGTRGDAFLLTAEIIELKEKPTMPWGVVNRDASGALHSLSDAGIRKRAILSLGKQDIDIEAMEPIDPGIKIFGASGDHLALDVTDAQSEAKVGGTVTFALGYYAALRAFTSPYVTKKIL